jgi:hypothetical protein
MSVSILLMKKFNNKEKRYTINTIFHDKKGNRYGK